jgi:hypothetical protein
LAIYELLEVVGLMAIKTVEIPLAMGQKLTTTTFVVRFSVFASWGWMKGQYVTTDLPKVGPEVYLVAPQTRV